MTNLISIAFLLIFFFVFVSNNSDWSLKLMKTELDLLDNSASEYIREAQALTNKPLKDLQIGELN